MPMVRSVLGGGTLVLATLGLAVCFAGIGCAWFVKRQVDAVGDRVGAAAQESLDFVDVRIDRVRRALASTQQRVTGIADLAKRLQDARVDHNTEVRSLMQTIDEVFADLKAAESWLDSGIAAANGVARVSEAIAASSYAAAHEDSKSLILLDRLREASERIAEALGKVEALRRDLVEARDSGKLAREVVRRIVDRVADIDGIVATIAARVDRFDARVTAAKTAVDEGERRFHRWSTLGAAAMSAVLAWFALSQISMLRHGWRALRPIA